MSKVSFKTVKADTVLIQKIVARAEAMACEARIPFDHLAARMDLTAVHVNDCPLRLAALLEAKEFDFSHDVFGIFRHIDRNTGSLRNHFLPRYARAEDR